MSTRFDVISVGLLLVLCGCSGGTGTGGTLPIGPSANLSADKLQFAVGTINGGGAPLLGIGLAPMNLVATFRQPNGLSALLADSITMQAPQPSTGAFFDGGGPNEFVDSLAGDAVYGEGFHSIYESELLEPPPGDSVGGVGNVVGPPAFPSPAVGTSIQAFAFGASQVDNNPGPYTLTVSTPPGSSQSQTWSATATLYTRTLLPTIPQPTVSLDGQGGGAVAFIVPPLVTEVFVSVNVADDACYPSGNATAFALSFFMKNPTPGPMTFAFGDDFGPVVSGKAYQTVCSAAQNASAGASGGGAIVSASVTGVDYPLYEMSYPESTTQLPTITGNVDPDGNPNHQADVTISLSSAEETAP